MKKLYFSLLCLLPCFLFAQQGMLDPSFGMGGRLLLDLGYTGLPSAINVVETQTDGKIVAGGYIQMHSSNGLGTDEAIAILRIKSDGSYDSSFNGNGRRVMNLAPDSYEVAHELAILPDGRIMLLASAGGESVLIRLKQDGSPDSSFNATGIKRFADFFQNMMLQPDGKVVMAGLLAYNSFIVKRYFPDGSPDLSFNNNTGMNVITPTSPGSDIYSISVYRLLMQPDGKILVGTTIAFDDPWYSYDTSPCIIRLNADGSMDQGFGGGFGYIYYNMGLNIIPADMVLLADGKMLVGGGINNHTNGFTFISRINSNGTMDTAFQNAGILIRDFNLIRWDAINKMQLQNDGKVLLGMSWIDNNIPVFTLGRVRPDGNLDSSFASLGFVTTYSFGRSYLSDISISGNRIIAAGTANLPPNGIAQSALAVYVNCMNAAPVITFNNNQLQSSATTGNQWYLNGVAINGATGAQYSPVQSGVYTVAVTAGGCTSPHSIAFHFATTAIPGVDLQEGVTIGPNPVVRTLHIRFRNSRQRFAKIYNLQGQVVYQGPRFTTQLEISMDRLGSGVYILKISDEEKGKQIERTILKR